MKADDDKDSGREDLEVFPTFFPLEEGRELPRGRKDEDVMEEEVAITYRGKGRGSEVVRAGRVTRERPRG